MDVRRMRSLAVIGVSVVVGAFALAVATLPRASAAPTQGQVPLCAWERLPDGESRAWHTFVEYPTSSALAYGGVEMLPAGHAVKDDVHVLERAGGGFSWRELSTSGDGPGPRFDHAAVMHARPIGGFELLVYGGIDDLPDTPMTAGAGSRAACIRDGTAGVSAPLAPASVHSGTWRLDLLPTGGVWSRLDAPGAEPRAGHGMIYWPTGNALLVFGGHRTTSVSSIVSTTLRLTLDDTPTWEALPVAGDAPPARTGHTVIYDPDGDRMIVYGGMGSDGTVLGDLWALNLGGDLPSWEQLQPGGEAPVARQFHAAMYVAYRKWLLVFGGMDAGSLYLGDVWALDLSAYPPSWSEIEPTGSVGPRPRSSAALAYGRGRLVLYGGQTGYGPDGTMTLTDTWHLNCLADDVPTPTDTSVPTVPPTDTPTPTDVPTATETAPLPPTGTPTPTASPVVTATATESATVTATAPVTATIEPRNIDLHGLVYEPGTSPATPIEGARIVVPPCFTPHQSFMTTTGADGRYALTLPTAYFMPGCTIEITVSADEYESRVESYTWEDLAARPERDFALVPLGAATPTPTSLPSSVDLHGLVYDAEVGRDAPLTGAHVTVPACRTPHQAFTATTGADGRYVLTLPSPYFDTGCTVEVTVTATRYETAVRGFGFVELQTWPERDFALRRVPLVDAPPIYVPYARLR